MNFEEFFKPPIMPISIDLESPPIHVLTYIRQHGYLQLDIDFIDDYITKVTPDHPDEWAIADELCVDEIVSYRDRALKEYDANEASN